MRRSASQRSGHPQAEGNVASSPLDTRWRLSGREQLVSEQETVGSWTLDGIDVTPVTLSPFSISKRERNEIRYLDGRRKRNCKDCFLGRSPAGVVP